MNEISAYVSLLFNNPERGLSETVLYGVRTVRYIGINELKLMYILTKARLETNSIDTHPIIDKNFSV